MNIIRNKKYIITTLAVLVLVTVLVLVIRGFGSKSTPLGYSIILPDVYTNALFIKTNQNNIFSVTPALAKEVVKKESKNITTYKDAYEQSNVVFTVGEGKLKEDIVLKAPGHPLEFSWQLDLENFSYELDSAGNYLFYAKNNNALQSYSFMIPAPFMTDAKGTRSSGSDLQSKITEDGKFIITLDEGWLAQAQYPVTIDPTIQIQILNVHSSPQQGEDWTVNFTTLGTSDLRIIPDNEATVSDDEFVSLSCDGRILKPQILENDIIFYPNWQCDGIGEVVHFTKLAGKHTLRFEYGGQTAYAYNSDWWNASWTKRKKIMLDTTTTATTSALTNYPLPVQFNASRIDYTNTKDNGEDIRFVDPDGTLLNYEIEKWNETGTSTVWVKVPTITAYSNTDYIYVYYGNTVASDNSTTTGVWDDNFVMVQHFNETAGYHQDSTKYANNTTYQSGITSQGTYPGKLDGADDGDNLRMEVANNSNLSGMAGLTLEGWIKMESFNSGGDMIYRKNHSASPWDSYYLRIFDDQVMTFEVRDTGGSAYYINGATILATSTWYYVVGSYNGSQAQVYINSSPDDPTPASITGNLYSSDDILSIGGTNYPDASFDEFRISDTARSLGWIKFSYCTMTDSCVSYASSEESINWWNADWKYRRKISFNTTTSATTTALTDFPAVVQLNSSRIDYGLVQDAGQDIRFVDGDEELPYEIEKWDETGTSTIWVKVPQVDASSTADHIWMYYGNSTATDNSTTTGVWDENYVGVYHLSETSGQHLDSSKYSNHPTSTSVTNQGTVIGVVDGASNFNGSTNEIDISHANSLNLGPVTLDAWIKPSAFSHIYNFIFFKGNSSQANYAVGANSSGALCIFSTGNTCSSYILSTGIWTHVVAEMTSGSNTNLFINGVYNQSLADGYDATNTILLSLGNAYTYNRQFTGDMDELRISSINRGANWNAFEYCNMNDTCNTYSARENYADISWWNADWTRRRKISFDTTTSATTTALIDFPVAVQFNSSRIDYNFTQNAGQDIRFIDGDGGTQLSYEIEKWNEAGTSTVWVKVPTIDKNSTADFIYVYYGNNFAQDAQNKNDVWSNNYIMVRHFSETSTAYLDSTYHNNNSSFDSYTTNGKLGNAASTTGASIDVSNNVTLDGMDQLTLEAWVNLDNVYEDDYIFRKYHTVSPWDSYSLYQRATNHVEFNVRDTSGSNNQAVGATSLATSTWYYLSGVYDGNNVQVYINAVADDASPASMTGTVYDSDNYLASPGYNYPDGIFDEFRISGIGRSDGWLKFSYCNMNDGCTSYLAEEMPNDPPTINSVTISADDPLNSTSTPIDKPFTFNIDWTGESGEKVKAYICNMNSFTTSTQSCVTGSWGNSPDYTQTNPIQISYTPTGSPFGAINYYVYLCNDSYGCSGPTSGSFYKYAPVYRSMGYNNTSPLATASSTGSTNNLTISGTTATFSIALPDNVGVGDGIQYDSDSNGSIDKIVFIHGRTSPYVYLVRPATGTTTPTAVTNDADWGIYRSYITTANAETGTENTGIASAVRTFDAWSGGLDLVTNNLQWNIALYADAVETITSSIAISSWTTGVNNYLRIFTPVAENEVGVSQRHHGYMTDRAYKLVNSVTADYQDAFDVSQNHVRIDGLQCELSNPSSYIGIHCINVSPPTGAVYLSNNILKGHDDINGYQGGIKIYNGAPAGITVNIWNNIMYDFSYPSGTNAYCLAVSSNAGTLGSIYNNTFNNCNEAMQGRMLLMPVINNIAQNTVTCYSSWDGSHASTDYNICDNANGSPGSHSVESVNVTFMNPGVQDYRLHSSDNVAKDSGLDLSADTYLPFSTDIEGELRDGLWDIGADEIPLTTPIYIKGSTNVKGGLYIK